MRKFSRFIWFLVCWLWNLSSSYVQETIVLGCFLPPSYASCHCSLISDVFITHSLLCPCLRLFFLSLTHLHPIIVSIMAARCLFNDPISSHRRLLSALSGTEREVCVWTPTDLYSQRRLSSDVPCQHILWLPKKQADSLVTRPCTESLRRLRDVSTSNHFQFSLQSRCFVFLPLVCD